jgi:hypothetical protein
MQPADSDAVVSYETRECSHLIPSFTEERVYEQNTTECRINYRVCYIAPLL